MVPLPQFDGTSLNLTTEDGRTATVGFEYPIEQVLCFETMVVVRLKSPAGVNENVFGVSTEGQIVWRVPKLKYPYEDSPFTGVSEEDGMARLFNWCGLDLWLDPATGEIIKERFSRY